MRNNRRKVKQLGMFVDITNIILGISIIIIDVAIIITGGNVRILFPLIFAAETVINLLAGIKQQKSNKLREAIALYIVAAVFLAVTVISIMIVS